MAMDVEFFLNVALDLDQAGLIWTPEIGDEISQRVYPENISILVNPKGAELQELRSTYFWLPNTEQLITQLEARQVILYHAGLDLDENNICYRTVVKTTYGALESQATSLRTAMALSLLKVITGGVH